VKYINLQRICYYYGNLLTVIIKIHSISFCLYKKKSTNNHADTLKNLLAYFVQVFYNQVISKSKNFGRSIDLTNSVVRTSSYPKLAGRG
jgi:hypothetical protein